MSSTHAFFLGVALTAIVMSLVLRTPQDSTDPSGGRSGMALYTDHKTGLQYLGNPRGGITPRLDTQGNHMRDMK